MCHNLAENDANFAILRTSSTRWAQRFSALLTQFKGEYNLNVLKEIKVTEFYLGLNQEDRQCQNKEPHGNCTTRHYKNIFLGGCGCVPLNIGLSNEAFLEYFI